MDTSQKICFVIMGFGKKQDPYSTRTIDLDESYNKIINTAVTESGYHCIRADQIIESAMIDRSMYALLHKADLVIADLTTLNPNAMYELGVRHTMRPSTTIIIGAGLKNIPFDINHIRIMPYDFAKDKLSKEEADKAVSELKHLINSAEQSTSANSPLYTLFPKYDTQGANEEMEKIIDELQYDDKSIYALTQKAKDLMASDAFVQAADIWHELSERSRDDYFIQQEALATYKSEIPDKVSSLKKAREIIGKIQDRRDCETLGITGAIYKRLWEQTGEASCLDSATSSYQLGWDLYGDYYTGENYAFCLDRKADIETDVPHKDSYRVQAMDVREKIIADLEVRLKKDKHSEDLKWICATLANCYLAVGKRDDATVYEGKFKEQNPADWEWQTYIKTKEYIANHTRR